MKRSWRRVRPVFVIGPVVLVPLNTGQFAVVDTEDLELVQDWNWTAKAGRNGVTYARRNIRKNGRVHPTAMHSLLLPTTSMVDHINGDGLINCRHNLRPATHSQNGQNKRKTAQNTSGYKGVHFRTERSRWVAKIQHNGKTAKIGSFQNPVDAARAYDKRAIELFGEYALLNFPRGGNHGMV